MDVVRVLKRGPDDSVARVPAPVPRPRRGPPERLAAWLVTGPLGHLYSVVADLTVYFVRWRLQWAKRQAARIVERLP